MSPKNDHSDIVDLTARARAQKHREASQLGTLLKPVLDHCLKHFPKSLSIVFENTDDALFDIAEKAGNNQEQNIYFDGMRAIRKERARIEGKFETTLRHNFKAFSQGEVIEIDSKKAPDLSSELSLVDDVDLEEDLAISNMVSKAENRYAQNLFALNERMSVLQAGRTIEDDTNPLGPAQICEAFRKAAAEIDADIRIKLIVYKLFDKYVMASLPTLYQHVNQQLIDSGILPELRPQLRRPAGQSFGQAVPDNTPLTGNPADTELTEAHAYTEQTYAPEQDEPANVGPIGQLFQNISNLLQSRRGISQQNPSVGQASGIQANPAPSYNNDTLLNALSLLQQEQALPTLSAANPQTVLPAAPVQKQALIDQLSRLDSDEQSQHQIASPDEDAIDLVGMLFEFIVQDRNLPANIQALLSRLQIPYLKAALIDRHVFAQKQHPARLLLDELAQAGLGWTEESDKNNRIISKITSIVEKLSLDFNDDMSLFTALHEDFQQFLEKIQHRAKLAEQRTMDKVHGQEKLDQAKKTAATALKAILETAASKQPAMIHSLITQAWTNVMVLIYLRQGEDSKAWKNALRVAHDLLWIRTVHLHPTDANRAKLEKLHPILNIAIVKGLKLIAYHQDQINQTTIGLEQYISHILHPDELKPIVEKLQDKPIKAPAGSQEGNLIEEFLAEFEEKTPEQEPQGFVQSERSEMDDASHPIVENTPKLSHSERNASLEALEKLETGTWFEFTSKDGSKIRAKLSWISPISGKYLFVNQKGVKIGDKSLMTLSDEIASGTTTVLDQAPLLDRAMGAIAEQLSEELQTAE